MVVRKGKGHRRMYRAFRSPGIHGPSTRENMQFHVSPIIRVSSTRNLGMGYISPLDISFLWSGSAHYAGLVWFRDAGGPHPHLCVMPGDRNWPRHKKGLLNNLGYGKARIRLRSRAGVTQKRFNGNRTIGNGTEPYLDDP